jgi:tRNA nucleotidyltransferase (CCA-adding enzyme)
VMGDVKVIEDKRLHIAQSILRELDNHHYQAYLVGGYVRDQQLGRTTKDIDIATSAKPEEVIALFKRTEPTGLQHGTVTVIIEGIPFEVTTFRTESGYHDFRRPQEVQFIQHIEGDLSRRDFTMNAMALDRENKLIDPFGGSDDLALGLLRCVGDPQVRFSEDALRMMRCIRFAAEYDLQIQDETWQALLQQAPLLKHVAMERISAEIERLIEGRDPERGLRLLTESKLHDHFKTRIAVDWINNVPSGLARVVEPVSRWVVLMLHGRIQPHGASETLKLLSVGSRTAQEITTIMEFHDWLTKQLSELDDQDERIWKQGVLKYGKAAVLAWHNIALQFPSIIVLSVPIEDWIARGQASVNAMPATTLRDLQINGNDLLHIGIKPGKHMGQTLQLLLQETASGHIANKKEPLLARALELKQSRGD